MKTSALRQELEAIANRWEPDFRKKLLRILSKFKANELCPIVDQSLYLDTNMCWHVRYRGKGHSLGNKRTLYALLPEFVYAVSGANTEIEKLPDPVEQVMLITAKFLEYLDKVIVKLEAPLPESVSAEDTGLGFEAL